MSSRDLSRRMTLQQILNRGRQTFSYDRLNPNFAFLRLNPFTAKCLLPFFPNRRSSLPMANVDDDVLRTDKLVLIIGCAEVERPSLFSAGGFQHTKLLLVILSRKSDVIDARLFGRF